MRRILISLTVIALLFMPQFAAGDDVTDLKATYERLVQALNSLNAEAIASTVYPGRIIFGYNEAFPIIAPMENTKENALQDLKASFSTLEYLQLVPYNMQYRVIGNTGIAWGHSTEYMKTKGEVSRIQHARFTSTWIKEDGKWYNVMYHTSAIPQSN